MDSTELVLVSNIVGNPIRNSKGDQLGTVEEIVLDPQESRVALAVISPAGTTGKEIKFHAIPWEAVDVSKSGDGLTIEADKARLSSAPGFGKNDWSRMITGRVADNDEIRRAYEFWSVPSYWTSQSLPGQPESSGSLGATLEPAPAAAQTSTSPDADVVSDSRPQMPPILRASKAAGMTVKNDQGDELGTVEDIVLDPATGDIAYVMISHGGWLGIGDKLVAVQWSSVRLDAAQKALLLSATEEQLAQAREIEGDEWPETATFHPSPKSGPTSSDPPPAVPR